MLLAPDDGRVLFRYQATTWLLAARTVGEEDPAVACVDLGGNVTYLSLPELHPLRTVHLGGAPRPTLLFSPAMPTRWGAGMEAIFEEEPAVLAADRRGFIFLLSVPGQ
jgi:hypothetical protein